VETYPFRIKCCESATHNRHFPWSAMAARAYIGRRMKPPATPTTPPSPSSPEKSGRIFEYQDFRQFFQDRYEIRKLENPAFSLRYIAAKTGMDAGTLSRVMKGQRKLDSRFAGRLGQALGLIGDEKEYFENLVLFSQAKSQTEKNHFYEKLLKLMGSKVRTLEERQYEYYRNWYHVALRELLNTYEFKGDYPELARQLRPAIRPQEARKAVQLLEESGLVEKDAEGRYTLTEALISSGHAISSMLADNFHTAMGEIALRAIQEMDRGDRSFSALTLSLSAEGFQSVDAALGRFRRTVMEIAKRDAHVNGVYQMNFQMFPLSRTVPGTKP
jgi:uncharacterized protein (TIGR02147 family)